MASPSRWRQSPSVVAFVAVWLATLASVPWSATGSYVSNAGWGEDPLNCCWNVNAGQMLAQSFRPSEPMQVSSVTLLIAEAAAGGGNGVFNVSIHAAATGGIPGGLLVALSSGSAPSGTAIAPVEFTTGPRSRVLLLCIRGL